MNQTAYHLVLRVTAFTAYSILTFMYVLWNTNAFKYSSTPEFPSSLPSIRSSSLHICSPQHVGLYFYTRLFVTQGLLVPLASFLIFGTQRVSHLNRSFWWFSQHSHRKTWLFGLGVYSNECQRSEARPYLRYHLSHRGLALYNKVQPACRSNRARISAYHWHQSGERKCDSSVIQRSSNRAFIADWICVSKLLCVYISV